jgi:hypothetical protein
MRVYPRFAVVVWLPLSLALASQAGTERDFDQIPPGASPPGFTFGSMRQPEPGRWTVQQADGNGFLCHERDESTGYSLAIAEGAAPANLVMTVRVRLTEGARAGGLVWRYLNDKHYYSLILDLNQRRIALVRVSSGHHIVLDAEDDLELDANAWHTLKVVHVGKTVRASLGGVHVFEDEDRRNAWGDEATRVGVIATGNSRVEFDDLRVAPRGDHP